MPTFDTPNSQNTWTVSANTVELEITVRGGTGGHSENGGAGGAAGEITATVSVSGGESVTASVGEAGGVGEGGDDTIASAGGAGGQSPLGDAGNGGDINNGNNFGGAGGGGGAASGLTLDGVELARAGGGGGGGGYGTRDDYRGAGGGGGSLGGVGGDPGDGDFYNPDPGGDAAGTGNGGDGGKGGGVNSGPGNGQAGGVYTHSSLTEVTTGTSTASPVVEITELAPPVAPANLGTTDIRPTEIDIAWDDVDSGEPDPEDGFRVYISDDGGSTWTQVADLAADTESYTITGLLHGEQYDIRVEAFNTYGTASDSITRQTTLPDAVNLTLDNTVEDEITAEIDDVTNDGDVRFQIRETGESSWDSNAVGYAESVVASDGDTSGTISTVFGGLEDGEEYEVRARTETEHVTGSWTTPAPTITVMPAPSDLQIDNRFGTVDASFTDNSDNETSVELQRSTDGGTTWTTVDSGGANVTSLTDASPAFYDVADYRVEQFTDDASATSNVVTTVAARADDTFWAEIHKPSQPGGDELLQETLAPERITSVDQLALEHTAISGWGLTVAPAFEQLRDYHLGDVTLWSGDQKLIRGPLQSTPQSSGTISLSGEGPGHLLRTDTTVDTYENLPYWKAIEDYVSYIPADTWSVVEPFVRTVDSNEVFVDAPTTDDLDVFFGSFSSTDPVVASFDSIRPARTAWFLEAEDGTVPAAGSAPTTVSSGSWGTLSGDSGEQFQDAGEMKEWDFTPEHDIPAADFEYAIRWSRQSWTGQIEATLNGTQIDSFAYSSSDWGMEWTRRQSNVLGNIPDPLQAGTTYTLRIAASNNPTTGTYEGGFTLDCAVPLDNGDRLGGYSTNFDNTVDTTHYTLDGPQEYPAAYEMEGSETSVWHINESEASLTIDDTSTDQAIAQSTDGTNYVTASNTASQTVDFDAQEIYGNTIHLRVTLSRYASDTTTSPATGDTPQELTGVEIRLTTDDLPIISDPLTLDGDTWFQNVQTLHSEGDMRFTIDHRADGLVVESYRTGDSAVLKTGDWTTSNENAVQRERTTEEYANAINVKAPDVGFSPFSLRLSDEETRVNTREERGLVASSNDRDEAVLEAREELRRRVGRDEFLGSIQIVPTWVAPGYPYQPSEFDGDQANLQRVDLAASAESASGTLEFGADRDLAAAFNRTQSS